jgi:hypothetical protein
MGMVVLALAVCDGMAALPIPAGPGPQPTLPVTPAGVDYDRESLIINPADEG